VVYAIAFNNPFGDKIVTGSFDKTAKLWDAETGECLHTLRGHQTEIVALSFNPQSTMVATGSMDNTAKLWAVDTGEELASLLGHQAEIVSLCFNNEGDKIITGSFDHTTKIWVRPRAHATACVSLHGLHGLLARPPARPGSLSGACTESSQSKARHYVRCCLNCGGIL
jgi:WD40 repeat protein